MNHCFVLMNHDFGSQDQKKWYKENSKTYIFMLLFFYFLCRCILVYWFFQDSLYIYIYMYVYYNMNVYYTIYFFSLHMYMCIYMHIYIYTPLLAYDIPATEVVVFWMVLEISLLQYLWWLTWPRPAAHEQEELPQLTIDKFQEVHTVTELSSCTCQMVICPLKVAGGTFSQTKANQDLRQAYASRNK